jgi:hypothetical protein
VHWTGGLIRDSTWSCGEGDEIVPTNNSCFVMEDSMEESPSMMLTRGMMHDSTSETQEVQLMEHQGYRGMKVLFLERRDDWSISRIRMARRMQLATQAWLVRRKVDQHVIGWRELQVLRAVSCLDTRIHMRKIVAAMGEV